MTIRLAIRRWLMTMAVAAMLGCGSGSGAKTSPTPAVEPFDPPEITVDKVLPIVKMDGQFGSVPVSSAASYAWSALIALNWPAAAGASQRGLPDESATFGQPGTPTWITMRSKVELYPGNGSATVPPHGVALGPDGKPQPASDYGYGAPPRYIYGGGREWGPCAGQAPVQTPALITLDETTQIGNNQTFAGAAPAIDPRGFNSQPQLIRYAVKMDRKIFARAIGNRYWYSSDDSPLAAAQANYVKALNSGSLDDPAEPFVNLAPKPPDGAAAAGIEIKSSWRPLSEREAASGRFVTTTVRYYEQPAGQHCYREAVWGMVGMHVISYSVDAPWVIWSTFEQADNILTADGKPTEDEAGVRHITFPTPTTPALSSDPDVRVPRVTANGDYCVSPGSRLYFKENPKYFFRLPTAGNICVNTRWHEVDKIFITANQQAHQKIAEYKAKWGGSSPLMYYKLVGAQGVPVDVKDRNDGLFSTDASYLSGNITIETDYSLANFTGNLVGGAPANIEVTDTGLVRPFVNTRLLRFQSRTFDMSNMRMGGCAGCHGLAALTGTGFSFALGDGITEPEWTDAFSKPERHRTYFPTQ